VLSSHEMAKLVSERVSIRVDIEQKSTVIQLLYDCYTTVIRIENIQK